jgi:hypothetical protein
VGYWADKSGNNRHAVQATAGNRPAISATTQGGKKALAFASSTTTVVSPATVAQYVADATTSPKMFFAWVARPEGGAASIVWGSPTHPNTASRVFYAADFGVPGGHIVDFGSVSTARLTGTVGDEANNVGHVYSAFRDGAIMSVRRDGVEILRKTNTSGVYSDTTGTLSINTTSGGSATASWMEFLAYAASMPAANIARIERYLAARWGITLAPQVSNADAQDWINRVYANGGTVSTSTAGAVNTLCDSLDAASLRDRFYRLNLFCGSNLNAALVPLYRGPSLGGTQYGGTTDTNVGPFVSGDYAETGASGGLVGNGSSKYLDTGFAMNTLPSTTSGHAAVYCPNRSSRTAFTGMLGVAVTGSTGFGLSTDTSVYGIWGAIASATNSTNGLLLTSRTASDLLTTYVNDTSIATNTTSVTPAAQTLLAAVFANRSGVSSVSSFDSRRYCYYSIGLGLTQSQVTSLTSAIQTFQTSLARNV